MHSLHKQKLEVHLQDVNDLLSTQELFLIATVSGGTFHLISILDFHMQTHLGILWLKAIAVVALLLRTDEFVHDIQSPLSILDHLRPAKFVLCVFHGDPAAMEANTAQRFERYIDEPNVVHWTSQLNVTKITGIRLVMEITETRIIYTTVDWLSCHIGLLELLSK